MWSGRSIILLFKENASKWRVLARWYNGSAICP
jgi:hypothetical protein